MFFSKADAAALGIMYFAVFDDPPLTPVRTNQPRLKRGRRSPLCSGSAHRKAGYRDKINSFFLRKKAIRPHTDLRTAIVWTLSVKIAIEYRFLLFDSREPAERPFRCSGIFSTTSSINKPNSLAKVFFGGRTIFDLLTTI